MKIITAEQLREWADGIENSNHAAEVMQARISYAMDHCAPKEPDQDFGSCCSEQLENGQWVSTGCDCAKPEDTELAEWWRSQKNAWQEYQKYYLACTGGEDL